MSDELKFDIEDIDAEKAQQYLKAEVPPAPGVVGSNRKASSELVKRWAQLMLSGDWKTTHQGIAFDEKGKLVDGGHRLRAIILASQTKPDISVRMAVARGLTPEAAMTLDTGRKRSPGDYMTMLGVSNPLFVAATVRLCAAYDDGALDKGKADEFRKRAAAMPPAAQAEYLERYPQLGDSVRFGLTMKALMTPTSAAALHFLGERDRSEWNVAEFLNQVREGYGTNWGRGNAAYTLRELFSNWKRIYRASSSVEQLALSMKGFIKWANKEECMILAWRTTEDFPRLR